MAMKISLVIPMYNESKILKDTIDTLDKYMSRTFDDYEIIFSDDGSTDNSVYLASHSGKKNIRVGGYKKNKGKGCAVRKGMLAARGDIIIFTDCDLAYGTEVISEIVDAFNENPRTEIIIGSRNILGDSYEGYTPIRRLASKAYIKLLCGMGGFKLSDSQCGFKGFRRETVKRIFPLCKTNGFAFDFEILMLASKLGIKVGEIPVKIINHRQSKVKVFSDSFKMINDLKKIKNRIEKTERSEEKGGIKND